MIIATVVIICLGSLAVAWLQIQQTEADASNRLCNARPAQAKIIEIGTTNFSQNGDRISTALRFEVLPPYGLPYKARSSWLIEPAHIPDVRVGKLLPVKIDSHKEKVIFPDVAWAEFDWRRENELELVYEELPA